MNVHIFALGHMTKMADMPIYNVHFSVVVVLYDMEIHIQIQRIFQLNSICSPHAKGEMRGGGGEDERPYICSRSHDQNG